MSVWKAFVFQVYGTFLKTECQSSLYIHDVKELINLIHSSELHSTQKGTASPMQWLLSDHFQTHLLNSAL